MDKNEFRQAVKRNGLTCDEFADLVGRDKNTIYRFGDKQSVPYYARVVLRLLDERGGAGGLRIEKAEDKQKIVKMTKKSVKMTDFG